MILSSYPSIDLHGFDREYALFKVKDFISDCYKLKYEYLVIVHGIGLGIVRETCIQTLSRNKDVLEFKSAYGNRGCMLVQIRI